MGGQMVMVGERAELSAVGGNDRVEPAFPGELLKQGKDREAKAEKRKKVGREPQTIANHKEVRRDNLEAEQKKDYKQRRLRRLGVHGKAPPNPRGGVYESHTLDQPEPEQRR